MGSRQKKGIPEEKNGRKEVLRNEWKSTGRNSDS
jgi:hypothetical protein